MEGLHVGKHQRYPPTLPRFDFALSTHPSRPIPTPPRPGRLTQSIEGGQHVERDALLFCGQPDGEATAGPLDLHLGCQLPFELTSSQALPDFAEDFMSPFLLILEVFKVADEEDKGAIGVAP